MDEHALFLREGDSWVATVLAQGGWDPRHANGGAVLALLGHLLEDVPSLVPMTVSRFTADLMRPVPLGRRLRVVPSVVREGKKIQIVEFHVLVDDVEHVRATALRVREADVSTPDDVPGSTDARPADRLPPPEESVSYRRADAPGFLRGVDMREALGPDGTRVGRWIRLEAPVVAGEPIRPTARLVGAFDFANQAGLNEFPTTVTAINPDVTAHVLRQPTDEWVAITGDTRFHYPAGRGISFASLSDSGGVFAVVSLSQILQLRAAPLPDHVARGPVGEGDPAGSPSRA